MRSACAISEILTTLDRYFTYSVMLEYALCCGKLLLESTVGTVVLCT